MWLLSFLGLWKNKKSQETTSQQNEISNTLSATTENIEKTKNNTTEQIFDKIWNKDSDIVDLIPQFTERDRESFRFLADDFIRAIKKDIAGLKQENVANYEWLGDGWIRKLLWEKYYHHYKSWHAQYTLSILPKDGEKHTLDVSAALSTPTIAYIHQTLADNPVFKDFFGKEYMDQLITLKGELQQVIKDNKQKRMNNYQESA